MEYVTAISESTLESVGWARSRPKFEAVKCVRALQKYYLTLKVALQYRCTYIACVRA